MFVVSLVVFFVMMVVRLITVVLLIKMIMMIAMMVIMLMTMMAVILVITAVIGTLRFNDATAARTSKKTTTLHVRHDFFFFIFLPFLHYDDVKMPNFVFYRERKQATTKFYFAF